MKRYDQRILKFFLFSTPPVWLVLGISYLRGSSGDWFNATAGISIVSWILMLSYVLIKMVMAQTYREEVLARPFGLRIADEREEAIGGMAARKGQLFLISVICILLFLSILKVSLVFPRRDDRERGSLSIGFGYSLVNKEEIKRDKTEFGLKGLPLSKEGILTLMLIFQLSSYHFYFRRKIRPEHAG